MAVRMLRIFRIQCDVCLCVHRTLDDYPTRTQALQQAIRERWIILNGQIECPSCQSKSKVERCAPLFASHCVEQPNGRLIDAIC